MVGRELAAGCGAPEGVRRKRVVIFWFGGDVRWRSSWWGEGGRMAVFWPCEAAPGKIMRFWRAEKIKRSILVQGISAGERLRGGGWWPIRQAWRRGCRWR